MSERQATADVLAFLTTLSEEALLPREVQRRLREVQARHPDVVMELVWEEESYDSSLHYDVLVRPIAPTSTATISLSVCADGALPWPLRGVRRWSDADLMQVNGKILKMQDAVSLIDVVWQQAPIMERLVDVCLIREELERHPVTLSDEDLQRGLDTLRRAHRLAGAAETQRWMEARGLTHESLERLVADRIIVERLRERVAAGRVERYFEAHRDALATAQVARIAFSDAADARRVHDALVAGALDFMAAAERQFFANATLAATTKLPPLFATLRRRELAPDVGEAIFTAPPSTTAGAILPPARDGEHYVITRVIGVAPARLDEPTRVAIKALLLDEWLAERKRVANITWFWGRADRASSAA